MAWDALIMISRFKFSGSFCSHCSGVSVCREELVLLAFINRRIVYLKCWVYVETVRLQSLFIWAETGMFGDIIGIIADC